MTVDLARLDDFAAACEAISKLATPDLLELADEARALRAYHGATEAGRKAAAAQLLAERRLADVLGEPAPAGPERLRAANEAKRLGPVVYTGVDDGRSSLHHATRARIRQLRVIPVADVQAFVREELAAERIPMRGRLVKRYAPPDDEEQDEPHPKAVLLVNAKQAAGEKPVDQPEAGAPDSTQPEPGPACAVTPGAGSSFHPLSPTPAFGVLDLEAWKEASNALRANPGDAELVRAALDARAGVSAEQFALLDVAEAYERQLARIDEREFHRASMDLERRASALLADVITLLEEACRLRHPVAPNTKETPR